ncbi:MAG: hypothetical protein M0C28_01495 [Candidatus Moduliflexus flocculans]|nr:hypothetical protein [Candidatus Moduliflexus flocculans]
MAAGLTMLVSMGLMSVQAIAQQTPQLPLLGKAIPKWVDPLPALNIVAPGATQLVIEMKEFQFPILPAGAVPGYTGTWVWGYVPNGQVDYTSYLGPVVLAERGTPTELKFINNLGFRNAQGIYDTNVLAYKYSVDQTPALGRPGQRREQPLCRGWGTGVPHPGSRATPDRSRPSSISTAAKCRPSSTEVQMPG